jgi:hypothetical protein
MKYDLQVKQLSLTLVLPPVYVLTAACLACQQREKKATEA